VIEVKVDFDRCDANGTCAALMPEVFRIGDDGLLEQLATEVEAASEGSWKRSSFAARWERSPAHDRPACI